jgi:hypothetical protein
MGGSSLVANNVHVIREHIMLRQTSYVAYANPEAIKLRLKQFL